MLASIATALFAQTTVGTGSIVGVVADPIIGDNSSELCPVIATSSCRRRIRRRCSATDRCSVLVPLIGERCGPGRGHAERGRRRGSDCLVLRLRGDGWWRWRRTPAATTSREKNNQEICNAPNGEIAFFSH